MSTQAFVELLGEKLLKEGKTEVATDAALADVKAVAIYFSAHWCPPCRGFTPKLAEWYKADLKAKGLEVVFASSDRDEKAFDEYFAEMPWLSLPYSARDLKEKLSKKYKVQGIPSLVILDTKGEVITLNGRDAVSGDPKGEEFPWIPPAFKDILGSEFVDQSGKNVGLDALKGKYLGLYFSAHWCPPCRNFTPKFAETYKKLKEEGKNLEVVFVSSDREEDAFKEYFAEMPWLALPYANRKQKEKLSRHFDVAGIPSLVIMDVDKDFEIVNASAVGKVRADEVGANFPWTPDTVKEIDEDPEGIDEGSSLVILQEGLPKEEQEKNVALIKPIAQKYIDDAKAKKDDADFMFFHGSKGGDLSKRVRDSCKLSEEKDAVKVVLMDIPSGGAFYSFKDTFNAENIQKFLDDYKGDKLERQQMGN